MDDWPSPSAPPDPFDPLAVDLWLVQQEEAFAELIARRLTRIVRDAYGAFLDSLPPEEVITAAGDLYELESIVPRWRVVVRTDLVPRLERMYLTGSIAAFTVASMDGDEPRQEIPPGEIEGWARVVNEQAVAYAQTATNRLVGVGDTVFDLIKNRTAKAIERGATNEELKRQVETLAGFSEFRADVVARTEVGMAYGTGDYEGMAALGEYGPVEKEWLAAIDARTRETHVAANGQRVPMNEPFQVGGAQMMYAKQPGAPAREVIQCRCTTLYHFAGDVRPDGSIVGGEALPIAAPAPAQLPVQPAEPVVAPPVVERAPVPVPEEPPKPVKTPKATPKPKAAPKPKKPKPVKPDTKPRVVESVPQSVTWDDVRRPGAQYINSLPSNERASIIDYATGSYDMINNWLRGRRVPPADWQPRIKRTTEQLKRAVDNAPPLDGDARVFRGVGFDVAVEPGDIVSDKGFLSTSFDRRVAEQFATADYDFDLSAPHTLFEITVPKGTRALPINDPDAMTDERELLLNTGTRLRVVSVEKRGGQRIVRAVMEAG